MQIRIDGALFSFFLNDDSKIAFRVNGLNVTSIVQRIQQTSRQIPARTEMTFSEKLHLRWPNTRVNTSQDGDRRDDIG